MPPVEEGPCPPVPGSEPPVPTLVRPPEPVIPPSPTPTAPPLPRPDIPPDAAVPPAPSFGGDDPAKPPAPGTPPLPPLAGPTRPPVPVAVVPPAPDPPPALDVMPPCAEPPEPVALSTPASLPVYCRGDEQPLRKNDPTAPATTALFNQLAHARTVTFVVTSSVRDARELSVHCSFGFSISDINIKSIEFARQPHGAINASCSARSRGGSRLSRHGRQRRPRAAKTATGARPMGRPEERKRGWKIPPGKLRGDNML